QNEVGQIVARGLARSENQDESATILRLVVPLLDKQTTPAPVCVCDDANETRGMVAKVFGANVKTMQEPYSRNTVIAEKLIDKPERKALTQKLSSALYDVAGNIRSPEAMASDCLSVLRDVKLSSHDLKTGAKYKRNPPFAEFDFITVSQTIVYCRGVLPDLSQTKYLYKLLTHQPSQTSIQERLRPGSASLESIISWNICTT
ncbi:hypothetical protein L916_12231, partial [Phytophthora nicotianae]